MPSFHVVVRAYQMAVTVPGGWAQVLPEIQVALMYSRSSCRAGVSPLSVISSKIPGIFSAGSRGRQRSLETRFRSKSSAQ